MARTFTDRLKSCMERGKLSPADIARWFRRSYPTVTNWVTRGALPRGPRSVSIFERLEDLETAIKKKRGFPVPDEIGAFDRPAYIERLRDGNSKRIPRSNSTRKRVANSSHKRSAAKPARKSARARPAAKPRRRTAATGQAADSPATHAAE